jgi:hypothetical protein
MSHGVTEVQLRKDTLLAFEAYIGEAEAQWERMLDPGEHFLWSDASQDRSERVRKGDVLAELWAGHDPKSAPHGLIHDWVGAIFVPGVALKETLALIQDYDNHKNIYNPEVVDSKLLSRRNGDFKIYLRLLKSKIITVVMDTEHEAHYFSAGKHRWRCRSYSSRLAEVREPGTANETVLPADAGFGFLWRIHTYWSFEERDNGTVIECRAISLTRDIPFILRMIINPIVRTVPKESLINTLVSTRRALLRVC